MIVLGIDPACGHTGYAVIESGADSSDLTCIDSGVISPPRKTGYPLNFVYIFNSTKRLLDEYSPDSMAIEDVFFAKSVKAALRLGELRGILLLTGLLSNIPVHLYAPLQIRKTVIGNGGVKKAQVKKVIELLLGLEEEISSYDISDAMATAICHISHCKSKINRKI